jgi:molecular chaperone GrpE (heat shock protein)
VTDRLAYVNYVHGSLAGTTATALNGGREPLKALRNAETALAPQRTARAQLQTQIARAEQAHDKGAAHRVADLQAQLLRAEEEETGAEREIDVLKRRALRESETAKWEALREVGVAVRPCRSRMY